MRKILLLSFLVAMSASCTVVKIPYRSVAYTVDYQKYSNQGFFITESNSVSFEYEPVGSILVSIQPGYEVLEDKGRGFVKYSEEPKKVTEEDVLDAVKKESERFGANGVINLKISYRSIATAQSIWDGGVLRSDIAIEATGMAIKRK